MFLLVVFVFVLAAGLGYVYRQYTTRDAATVASQGSGVNAFASLAAADGKIVALKAGAELKKAEALAVKAALDEVHKILG